jgi:hypothetical protein
MATELKFPAPFMFRYEGDSNGAPCLLERLVAKAPATCPIALYPASTQVEKI